MLRCPRTNNSPSNYFFIVLLYLPFHADAVGLAPGLYCGTVTCYDVLEISRDEFNKTDLPKLYRKLARQFHPDRVKDEELRAEAEDKFRLVATAYETLKDDETRSYYDYYLDHPEERYYNYYQYYRLRTAPRVDVRIVIAAAILLISVVQYLSAHQKYREALRYAKEQVKFRHMAIEIARERGVLEFDKQTGKIKKKQRNGLDSELIISGIIEENISISGGYRPPRVFDTLAVQLVVFPIIATKLMAYLSAHQKYREALRYAKEQVKFRHMAIEIARERGVLEFDKQTGKIKKKQRNGLDSELIISGIIEENISISGGYRPPRVFDTLAVQLVVFPIIATKLMAWWFRWAIKYWVRREPYDDEAKLYMIRKNLKQSEEQFLATEPKLLDEYMVLELWNRTEFDRWKEAKDLEEKERLSNSGRYRQYKRFMKKQAGSTISFLDEM
uniref:J domain-containing protein n=1 Tax=Globodera pallida TaxID=36090 RepID=A0A183CAS0_GLOPA